MEEEIDVRPYIEALIKRWYWIVGAALLAGVVAFVAASYLPPSYEATALVAVIEPRDIVQFDERIRGTNLVQPLKAFPQLALSDQVLVRVLHQYPMEEIDTIDALRKVLFAEVGADATIIQFQVTLQDPQDSANLVNAWAKEFVDWTNAIYGNQNDDQVLFFLEQMEKAEQDLTLSEQALIDFQSINRTQVISNTLSSTITLQSDLLESQRDANTLLRDVSLLRNQLSQQTNLDDLSIADQLTALLLQLQAFGIAENDYLQVQLGSDDLVTAVNRQDQLQYLDELITTLTEKGEQINAELIILEPQILELQQQIQEITTEGQRLMLNKEIAEQTYIALTLKVQEEQIISADTSSGVRLASEASVPEKPVETGRMLTTIFAIVITIILGALIVLISVWWNEKKEASTSQILEQTSNLTTDRRQ